MWVVFVDDHGHALISARPLASLLYFSVSPFLSPSLTCALSSSPLPSLPAVAMQDGDAPVGEVDAVAAAREWLIAKGDFSSAAWGTGGCSLGEGKDDDVLPRPWLPRH